MEGKLLGRGAAAFTAISLLYGCGFSSSVPPAGSAAGATSQSTTSGTLLYVANTSPTRGVDILTFPQGTAIGKITNIGYPHGVCADNAGHVWITSYLKIRSFALYEFARGAMTPTKTIHRKNWLGECTVDPHGNVVVFATAKSAYGGDIEIWKPSLQGKPQMIPIEMDPVSGGYDGSGNLYLKGYSGSDPAFAELPKGSTKITWLTFKNGFDFSDETVAWDGTNVTLDGYRYGPVIYRLTITGKTAKVTSIVRLRDLEPNAPYALTGKTVVAARHSHGTSIGLYNYPAGGKPTAVFSKFYEPLEIAISSS